jgi:hypothetical protein
MFDGDRQAANALQPEFLLKMQRPSVGADFNKRRRHRLIWRHAAKAPVG